jgi:hypothetical protein
LAATRSDFLAEELLSPLDPSDEEPLPSEDEPLPFDEEPESLEEESFEELDPESAEGLSAAAAFSRWRLRVP